MPIEQCLFKKGINPNKRSSSLDETPANKLIGDFLSYMCLEWKSFIVYNFFLNYLKILDFYLDRLGTLNQDNVCLKSLFYLENLRRKKQFLNLKLKFFLGNFKLFSKNS